MEHVSEPPAAPAETGERTYAVGHAFRDMPFSRVHLRIGCVLFMTLAIEAWEVLILSYVLTDLSSDLSLSQGQVGMVISAVFLGMIPGALLWGPLSDRIGRKATATWSLVGYGVLAFAAALAPSMEMLVATRFLAGLVFAGIFTMTFPYFEELLPVASRGKAAVYLASGWPVGTLAAIGTTALFGHLGWRWVVAVSGVMCLWAIPVRRYVPESPYWLAKQGRSPEARQVLERLGAVDLPRDATLVVPGQETSTGALRRVLRGPIGRITVIQIVINFVFSWGYWGLQTWLPTLLQDRGLTASSSLSFLAISAVLMIPGYVSAAQLTARFGRKPIYVGYVLAAACGGFFFATAQSMPALYAGMFVLAFFSMGAWGVWDTWLGEFYPSIDRGSGYGLGIFSQRVANTIAPSIVGFLLASATGATTTILFVNSFLFAAAVCALLLPETEGTELS